VHGASLSEALAAAIGDLKSSALVALAVPMLFIVRLFGHDALALLEAPLIKLLHLLLQGQVRRSRPYESHRRVHMVDIDRAF
jgi:hypothetical protein